MVPGVTSAAVADEFDLQHRSFVFATELIGADGGVKFVVQSAVPLTRLILDINPLNSVALVTFPIKNGSDALDCGVTDNVDDADSMPSI